jgi:thiol-disulfide isomerase/thioredoxin
MNRSVMGWVVGLVLALAGAAQAAGMEGKRAPALALKDIAGTPHSLVELAAGRPTVVLFWASWCPYCKALMPRLSRLVHEYGQDKIAVVAISVWEDDVQDAYPVIRQSNYPFSFLLRGDKQTAAWRVKGTPGLFVLDAQGMVIYDRNARPMRSASNAAADSSPAGSADHWVGEVRAALDLALAAPTTP